MNAAGVRRRMLQDAKKTFTVHEGGGLGRRPPSDGGSGASNATTRGAAIARTRTARIAVFGVRGVTWLCAVEKKGGKKKKQDDSHAPARKPVWRGGARAPPRTPPTIAAQRFLNGFGEEF